jgi:TM2 domain-containing membrane protein YozV
MLENIAVLKNYTNLQRIIIINKPKLKKPMKIFKRSAALATMAIFVSQLFFSCSTSQEFGKNQSAGNELNIAQMTTPAHNQAMENVAVINPAVENAAKQEVAEASKQIILAYAKAETPIVSAKGNSAKIMFSKDANTGVKADKKSVRSVLKNVKNIAGLASPASPMAGDNQLVALILALLVGALGIHRFYLGYIWQGVVQLLTLGGCGIWTLIDIIRIIMGTLKPKDGEYGTTFQDL